MDIGFHSTRLGTPSMNYSSLNCRYFYPFSLLGLVKLRLAATSGPLAIMILSLNSSSFNYTVFLPAAKCLCRQRRRQTTTPKMVRRRRMAPAVPIIISTFLFFRNCYTLIKVIYSIYKLK